MEKIYTLILTSLLLLTTTIMGANAETLDSGTQTITVQDDDSDGINDTRIVVTDYEYGDITFKKTNANLNSTFRITTDTDTWTHAITVTNLKTVIMPGTPNDDYLGDMTADEFFDGMVEYGSVNFRLIGSGNISWTFADLPDNIIKVEIDDETAEEGVDYEIDGNDLTLTLSMSTHDVTAYFGEASPVIFNFSEGTCATLLFLALILIVGLTIYRHRKFGMGKGGKGRKGYS